MNRISIVLDSFGFFGGPERRAYRLALGLKKRGFGITIISIMKADETMVSKAAKNSIEVISITDKEDGSVLKSYRVDVFYKLRGAISKAKADMLFTFEFLADYTAKMSLIGKKIPVITFIGSTEWKWEKKKHRRMVMKKFVEKSKFYIANSRNVRENIIRVLPKAKEKTKVVYNPINTSYFKPIDRRIKSQIRKLYSISDSNFIFGSVVRFYNPKGADILIEAFAKSKTDAKLVIVGDGSMKPKLVEMIEKLDIKDRVLFLGTLEATPEIYNMFDVCVVPSQKGGFDNVVIESLACGVPTIATHATGIKEIAENEKHLLISDITSQSICENMKKMFYNYDRLGLGFSKNGRDLVVKKLDTEVILDRIEELIWA